MSPAVFVGSWLCHVFHQFQSAVIPYAQTIHKAENSLTFDIMVEDLSRVGDLLFCILAHGIVDRINMAEVYHTP